MFVDTKGKLMILLDGIAWPRRLVTVSATCLLVATLASGCATPAGSGQATSAPRGTEEAGQASSATSKDERREPDSLSLEQRRRSLDAVLAAHPDDLEARAAHLDASLDMQDFPAVLADSEVLLPNPRLTGGRRTWILVSRAEALIQAVRPREAMLAADQALAIDESFPGAWFARGWARYLTDHGLAEDAMADIDRGLQLQPDEGIAYYRRAVILEFEGRFDAALSDLERASQLAPEDRPIRQEYGILAFREWYSGQFTESVESFGALARRPDASDYAPLWLFIMRLRAAPSAEDAAKAELSKLAPAHQPHAWRDTLVDLMLGKSRLDAALAEADAAPTDRARAGRRCEANYYAAEQLLAQGNFAAAATLLEEADRTCPPTYVEAGAVAAERHRLEGGAPYR